MHIATTSAAMEGSSHRETLCSLQPEIKTDAGTYRVKPRLKKYGPGRMHNIKLMSDQHRAAGDFSAHIYPEKLI